MILGTGACAAPIHEWGASREQATATILIDNRANDVSEMTVTLVPDMGVARELGTVRVGEERAFLVPESVAGASYHLVCHPVGGHRFTSEELLLTAGDRFQWDGRANQVYFLGRTVALR